jgi:hypothetical protein
MINDLIFLLRLKSARVAEKENARDLKSLSDLSECQLDSASGI